MQSQYEDPRNGGGGHHYGSGGDYGRDATAGAGRRPPPRGDIAYWGHMITEGQHPPQPTDKFSRLLAAIAEYIKEHLDPKEVKALTPEKLSSFYRAVGGGGLDALFLDTPPSNLSQIYTTLGCSHSLEPSNDDFRPPQNPALTSRGFQIWQTVQLLIDPAEHVPYIRNAVHQFELRDPETGEYFPREIPEEAFPHSPDEATIRWHDEVFDKAHKEAALNSPPNPPGPHQPRRTSRPPTGERIIIDDPADLDDPGWWAGTYYRPRQRRRRHAHAYGVPPPRTRRSVPEFHVHPGIHTTTTTGPGGIREHHHHVHHPPGGLHPHTQHHTLPRHRPQSFVSTAATAGGGGPDMRPRPVVIDDDASITSSDVEGEEGGEYGIRGRQKGPPLHGHAQSYSHSHPRRPPSGPPPSQPLPRRTSQSRERAHSTSRRSRPRTDIPKAYVYVTPDGEPATIYPNSSGGIRVQPGLSPHHLHPNGPPRAGPPPAGPPLHSYSSYPNLNMHHPPPPPPAGPSHSHERGRSASQKYPIPSHPDPYAPAAAPGDLDSEFEPAHLRYLRPRSSSPPLGGGKKRGGHMHSHPPPPPPPLGGYSSGGVGGGGNYTHARYDSDDDDDYERDRHRGGRGRSYRDDADVRVLEDELDGWTFAEHAEREKDRERDRGGRRKSKSRSRSRGQPRRTQPTVYHYDRM